MVRTLSFHCWLHEFYPWSGNYNPACHVVQSKEEEEEEEELDIGTKLTGQPKESKLRCVFDYPCDFSVFGIFNTKRWRRKDMIS